jgi:anhydro-N-acetylmuramic acid kinase
MSDIYIGLMSGTSADGIDAALVDFSGSQPSILCTHYSPYSPELREKILALCKPGDNEIERLGEMDTLLGKAFATAVNQLLKEKTIPMADIKAIGSHGQTVRHMPNQPHRFTLQIGDPNIIAAETGIATVADFRRKDIAHGGQGAPLVPAFHQYLLGSTTSNRAIVNIGGIANVTLLNKDNASHVLGFDTGPGNVLMDLWMHAHHQKSHDTAGAWGATGQVNDILLGLFLSDPYFTLPAPKSTGREYFNLKWLENKLSELGKNISAVDVQATLTKLTAVSIINSITPYLANGEIIICGGGSHNQFLMSLLKQLAAPHFTVSTTEKYAIHPDWIEAVAFAWLARQTMRQLPGNLPSVTGASKTAILGGLYYPA